MKNLIAVTAASLVVGFAAASWMQMKRISPRSDDHGPEQPGLAAFDTTASAERRIRALEEAVVMERQARQLLEDEVFFLTQEIERLDTDSTEDPEVSSAEAMRESFRAGRLRSNSNDGRVDRLIDAGFSVSQAEWIVRREAELQMERLQRRFEAMRQSDAPRTFGFSRDSELRAELGDTDYERYLQAMGRSTTVKLEGVLPNSPAQTSGLQPGDEIIRYDGERVFSMMDVAGRIMQGDSEGDVVVDIARDGVPMQLVIPRGPLGVTGD